VRLSMLLGAAAVLTLSAVPASAQFTGVVVPPPAKAPPVAAAAAQTIAERRDSAVRVTMTNMKDWVDSAAATLGVAPAPVVTDSAQPPVAAAPVLTAPAPPATRTPETTEFREGAPAPNTATPIPMLALAGLVSLTSGLWLLRRRRA
jgi:LPXTG-motif cell wall-anchored protein